MGGGHFTHRGILPMAIVQIPPFGVAMSTATVEQVIEALRPVEDPELHRSIVDLDMVHDVAVSSQGVSLTVTLTVPGCPMRNEIQSRVTNALSPLVNGAPVTINFGVMTDAQRANVRQMLNGNPGATAGSNQAHGHAEGRAIPFAAKDSKTRPLLISSGKGGVGKSSVTTNLAVALAARGHSVGIVDADIYGFSIPRMLGIPDRLEAHAVEGREKPMIIPNERKVGDGLLRVVSTGMLVEDEGTALMWRGLMLTKAVEQFLNDVDWGNIEYLLIDMPPGTGDVQMGLARMLPRTDLVIVTTPAVSAQKVAIRAADMARRSFLRVAGVIENMSSFTCDHGSEYELFGSGGGQALADEIGVPLLGKVPIEPTVAAGSDAGEPVVLSRTGIAAEVFSDIARQIIEATPSAPEMAGCSARTEDIAVVTLRRSPDRQA